MTRYTKTKKTKKTHRKKLVSYLIIVGAIVCGTILSWHLLNSYKNVNVSKPSSSSNYKTYDDSIINSKIQQYSTDEASSLWVVVNKGRALPSSYVPTELTNPEMPLNGSSATDNMKMRRDAAEALTEMSKITKTSGVPIRLTSGYRSYNTQAELNARYAQLQGQSEADKTSAHAGHSEHQTGLAIDVEPLDGSCRLDVCFGNTPEGKWLVNNAYKYGFIIRYPKDKVEVTGYNYEPWHLRYVGKELAAQLYGAGQTMEEYFGLKYFKDYLANPYQLQ